jgi:hypothetical protein
VCARLCHSFLSEEEYTRQQQEATDSGLKALFSSPQYQAWLMQNHGRMKLDDGEGMRQPEFDD